mmetsp:Transcript_27819/g.66105  ORF Transcript_27819/g.66105 Transcript_27819/m.66105 type:complete len:424 (+) Transcript_27819:411-1682(+)
MGFSNLSLRSCNEPVSTSGSFSGYVYGVPSSASSGTGLKRLAGFGSPCVRCPVSALRGYSRFRNGLEKNASSFSCAKCARDCWDLERGPRVRANRAQSATSQSRLRDLKNLFAPTPNRGDDAHDLYCSSCPAYSGTVSGSFRMPPESQGFPAKSTHGLLETENLSPEDVFPMDIVTTADKTLEEEDVNSEEYFAGIGTFGNNSQSEADSFIQCRRAASSANEGRGWSNQDKVSQGLTRHAPVQPSLLREPQETTGKEATKFSHLPEVFVILFGVGEEGHEGIYSLRAVNRDDGLPRDTIIAFEDQADAERYACQLDGSFRTFRHVPNVCSIPPLELLDFCTDAGYSCRLEPAGSLLLPPDYNVGTTDWERSLRLRNGEYSVLDEEPELARESSCGSSNDNGPGVEVSDLEELKKQLERLLREE